MTIQVFSLDFDGCLLNARCHDEKFDVLENNKKLIKTLNGYIEGHAKSILMIGSSRQSIYLDYLSQRTNSLYIRCFPIYLQIADCLKIKFDPFLLADLSSNQVPGTTFHKSLQLDYPFGQRADSCGNMYLIHDFYRKFSIPSIDCIVDESKFCLLYAQMHKIAQDHPGKNIIFRFFDDRKKLLNNLRHFFSSHINLMPKQVLLEFHYYIGGEPRLFSVLQGCGIIDLNFKQTISQIMQRINEKPSVPINVIRDYDFSNMPPRQAFTIDNNDEYKKSLQYQNLLNQFLILMSKAEDLLAREQFKAHKTAVTLYKQLNVQLLDYQQEKLPIHEFRKNCHQMIAHARLELDQHRGWKEFLTNLLAAILMFAGVGYLIGVAIKKDWTLFKSQTDASKKLDQIDKQIDSFMPEL